MRILFFLILLPLSTLAQREASVRDLKARRVHDDSSFVYALPYQKGKAYLLIQGYQSSMSHKGEFALDFKMRKGTRICAARSGVVVGARGDSKKGGLKPKFLSEGNYIVIQHDDGSHGMYWHLRFGGALVKVGDTIEQGQVIGFSGNTGYSAFPHLHFEVAAPGKGQVPTRFLTRKGARYLRPGRWHRNR
jgi:murein DD-endopeptidase MepM/ murein hydrolase activator NlpD